MFDDISLFVRIVQKRSLAAAGQDLKLPAATVSRRLKKLEDKLRCQLIHRSARKFNLTAEGEVYYKAYADLVQQFEATSRHLSADVQQLNGKLTVLAPTNASVGILQPMWSEFIRIYPEIQLNLFLSNQTKDIHLGQVDMALRVGPQEDSLLFQKKLGETSTILVASPDYLADQREPDGLDALEEHRIILVNTVPLWKLQYCPDGWVGKSRWADVRPQATTIIDDIGLASQLARDGHGIVLLPVSEIEMELSEGALVRVLPEWQGAKREIFAVWPTGRLLSTRAKFLRDFMQDFIARNRILQGHIPV
ncbi:LysR family transcriptional regulator [uncultured Kiloniella sp.]|uniref:LysR family transcriptional regulator n=1 Tax=uncultured Kiloniella sp. TaxID=1133091 RepID=UPI002637AF50|nr:LysR family transcriptional regulator [uncultured Kiloniella sp.]